VHLWVAEATLLNDPAGWAPYLALCSPAELARHERITHEETRRDHLVARALVRTTLSHYSPTAPAAWRFVENAHGCPSIDPTQNPGDLRFNLSHSGGKVVCAVTRGREVGVDVEDALRRSRTTKIADRFFAPAEVAALQRLPESEQRTRFFTYWTLKEAYIKARGMGLAIPLRQFWFDLDEAAGIGFATDEALEDPAESWRFAWGEIDGHFPLAVALRCEGDGFALRGYRANLLEGHTSMPIAVTRRTTGEWGEP